MRKLDKDGDFARTDIPCRPTQRVGPHAIMQHLRRTDRDALPRTLGGDRAGHQHGRDGTEPVIYSQLIVPSMN